MRIFRLGCDIAARKQSIKTQFNVENFNNANFDKKILRTKNNNSNVPIDEFVDKSLQQQNFLDLIAEHKKHVKHIVFSGGGAKGGTYPGVYKALVESGLFDSIEVISGASIGAIFAVFAAISSDPDLMCQKIVGLNMSDLIGQGSSMIKKFLGIGKDGKPFREFMSKTIKEFLQESIKKYLKEDDVVKNHKINEILRKCLTNESEITFGDLKELRKIDPRHFKDLFITAVQQDNGKPVVFGLDDEDLSLALICRISISIPIVFEPVNLNGKFLVDGGYYSNIPTLKNIMEYNLSRSELHVITDSTTTANNLDHSEKVRYNRIQLNLRKDIEIGSIELNLTREALIREEKKPQQNEAKYVSNSETLILSLTEGFKKSNPIFKALYTNEEKLYYPSLKYKIMDMLCKKSVYGNYSHTERKEIEYKSIQKEYPLRTVELNTGEISTLDFKKASIIAPQLSLHGYYNMKNYLINHGMDESTPKYKIQSFLFSVFQHTEFYSFDIRKNKIAFQLYEYSNPYSKTHDEKPLLDLLDEYISFSKKNGTYMTLIEVLRDPYYSSKYIQDSFMTIDEKIMIGQGWESYYNVDIL